MAQIAEVDGGKVKYDSSLFVSLQRSLDDYPDEPALVCTHQSVTHLAELLDEPRPQDVRAGPQHSSCLTWSYRELQQASLKVVAALIKQDLGHGAHIVTVLPNGVEWALLLWSSVLGKYALSCLDPNSLTVARAEELGAMLRDFAPDVVVTQDISAAPAVDKALSDLSKKPRLKFVINDFSDQSEVLGWNNFTKFVSAPVEDSLARQITKDAMFDDVDRLHSIGYTSGTTTGRPKCVPKSFRQMRHVLKMNKYNFLQTPGSRYAVISANFRVIALTVTTAAWFNGGCAVFVGQAFSPGPLLAAITAHKINDLIFVPAMFHALAAHPDFDKVDLSSVKRIGLGADMVTRGLYAKVADAVPTAAITIIHGMTEGSSAFTTPTICRPGNLENELPWQNEIGPVGKVQVGTRLRIAGGDNHALRRGEIGELHFCSNGFARGYLHGEKPEDFYEDSHGRWFKTGDTGLIDDNGWVFLLGRKKDVIKRAGRTIMPAALESALDKYLKNQTSVLGLKHEILGQEPYAVVAGLGSRSKDEVMQFVLDTFGRESVLRGVATLQDLGLAAFPLNTTGKIMKRDLEGPVMQFLSQAEPLTK